MCVKALNNSYTMLTLLNVSRISGASTNAFPNELNDVLTDTLQTKKMTIYKWPYKNDHVRKWLTISLGWECSNSRNPIPVGGAGLAGGGCIGYYWDWAWSACDEEVEASCDIRGRACMGALGRVWCGVSECQAGGLLLEITAVVSWHSACEFKHPPEEADPLLMKSHACARLCERATRSCAESFITPTISFNLEPVSSFSLSVISSLLFLHLLVGVGTWGTGILVGVSLLAALVATIIGLLIRGMFSGRPGCSPSRCFVPLLVKRFEIGEVCKCFHWWQAVNGCEGFLWCSSFW